MTTEPKITPKFEVLCDYMGEKQILLRSPLFNGGIAINYREPMASFWSRNVEDSSSQNFFDLLSAEKISMQLDIERGSVLLRDISLFAEVIATLKLPPDMEKEIIGAFQSGYRRWGCSI